MSHYPSTAELASFRSAIMAQSGPRQASDPDHYLRRYRHGAAPWEVTNGIGYSGGSPTAPFVIHEADGGPFPMGYAVSCAWADAYDHSWARKVAGSMRKRAFRVLPDTAATEAAIALFGGW